MMMIPGFEWLYAFIFGCLVGSFLNVVILRLPPRLMWGWKQDAHEFLEMELTDQDKPADLVVSRSACPVCQRQLSWYENLPLVSFIALGGKCKTCKTPISWQYPFVEALMGVLAVLAVAKWGWNIQGGAVAAFFAVLVAVSGIDFKTKLIPDQIILPAIWAALIFSVTQWHFVTPDKSVIGAAVGYLSLWSVFWLFKIITKKEGMGYGDFKLLALIGALWGAQAILPVILISTVFGSLIGGFLLWKSKKSEAFPFGPYLAMGAVIYSLFGASLNALIFPGMPA